MDYTANGVGSNDQMFIDTLQDCVLHQHITEPTWYRQGVNPHTLDLVLTDEERMVDELRYLAALGKGDHLLAKLIANCYTSQRITYHNWTVSALILMDSGIKWELSVGLSYWTHWCWWSLKLICPEV